MADRWRACFERHLLGCARNTAAVTRAVAPRPGTNIGLPTPCPRPPPARGRRRRRDDDDAVCREARARRRNERRCRSTDAHRWRPSLVSCSGSPCFDGAPMPAWRRRGDPGGATGRRAARSEIAPPFRLLPAHSSPWTSLPSVFDVFDSSHTSPSTT
jgi:hypothetical protein